MARKSKHWLRLLGAFGYLLMFFSMTAGRTGLTATSGVMFGISLFLLSFRYIVDIVNKVSYGKAHIYQATIITAGLIIWFLIALISPYTDKKHIFVIVLEATTLFLAAFFWYKQLIREWKFNDIRQGINQWVRNNWGVLACVVYTFVMSLGTLKWVPIWDDQVFTNELIDTRNFNFILPHINLLDGHLSYAVSMLLFPGIHMGGENPYLGIRICILIYLLVDSVLMYLLFKRLLPSLSNLELTIVSIVFLSFTPVIGIQSPNLDYMGMIVIIGMVFFYYYDYHYLFIISGILLCFTKEPLAILYAGFLSGMILKKVVTKSFRNPSSCVRYSLFYSIPFLIWLVVYSAFAVAGSADGSYHSQKIWGYIGEYNSAEDKGGTSEKSTSGEKKDTGPLDVVGEIDSVRESAQSTNEVHSRYTYAVSKLIEMFVFHFLWIPFFLMLILLNIKIFRYLTELMPAISALIFTAIINCVCKTDDVYRNVVTGNILVLLISLIGVCLCFKKKTIRNRFLIILCILFIIEQFTIIDPATLYNRDVYSTGDGKIVYLNSDNSKNLYISSMIQTNRQGYDYGKYIEAILKTIDYDENTLILVPEMNDKMNSFSVRGVYPDNFWYDTKKNKLITLPCMSEGKTEILWGSFAYNGDVNICGKDKSEVNFDRVFLIIFPFLDNQRYIEGIFYQDLKMKSAQDVRYKTWMATAIELTGIDINYLEKRMGSESSESDEE